MNTSKKIEAIKIKYNYYIERERKAEIFFSNASIKECEKHLDLFMDITRQMSIIQTLYKRLTGNEMTKEEKLNGFK